MASNICDKYQSSHGLVCIVFSRTGSQYFHGLVHSLFMDRLAVISWTGSQYFHGLVHRFTETFFRIFNKMSQILRFGYLLQTLPSRQDFAAGKNQMGKRLGPKTRPPPYLLNSACMVKDMILHLQ